jgi:hypothetical protein
MRNLAGGFVCVDMCAFAVKITYFVSPLRCYSHLLFCTPVCFPSLMQTFLLYILICCPQNISLIDGCIVAPNSC